MSDDPFAKYTQSKAPDVAVSSDDPFSKYAASPKSQSGPSLLGTLARATPAANFIPPVVNFLDYPVRDLSARVVGAVKGGLPVDEASRAKFYREYEKSLPFAEIPETDIGKKVSAVAGFPGRVIGKGVEGLSNLALGPQVTKAMAPYAGAAADIAPFAAAKFGLGGEPVGTAAQRASRLLENQARGTINRAFETGAKVAGPTATDVIEQMQQARVEGQPLALTDIENPEVRALVGTVYRKGGAARAILDDFFKGRNFGQIDRVRGLIERHLSDEDMRETAAQLAGARSANARPLWDKAMAGEGMPSLGEQLNVALAAAPEEAKAAIHERLVRAQADGTATAPGAVWSPRLQELLNTPEVGSGVRRGYAMERRFAVGEGRPFNPHDYAVIGTDAAGEPIVGQVPNMRLLAVAKEGLDAIINDMAEKRRFGRPSKDELSYMAERNGLVTELDRLNPAYKTARDQWSGDTASMQALEDGRGALDAGRSARFKSPQDLAEHVAKLSPGDRQFFVLGVADKLQERLRGAIDTTDKSRIIKNEETRVRLRPLFESDEAADRFLSAMEREHQMRQTSSKVSGGSQTAERVADDRNLEGTLAGARAIAHAVGGNYLSAIADALRSRRIFGGKPNRQLNEAIAKMLADPNLTLGGRETILPELNVPPGAGTGLFVPAGAAMGQPHNQR